MCFTHEPWPAPAAWPATAAGVGTLLSTWAIGQVADDFSFEPVVVVASVVPTLATLALVLLVRPGKTADREGILAGS